MLHLTLKKRVSTWIQVVHRGGVLQKMTRELLVSISIKGNLMIHSDLLVSVGPILVFRLFFCSHFFLRYEQ